MRDKRLAILAARYVTISQFMNRMRRVADEIDAIKRDVGDEIRLTVAEREDIPEYARLLLKKVLATGLGQPELHPQSRERAQVVADAIHTYNEKRGDARADRMVETYADMPIGAWSELPREFAGVRLIPISDDEIRGFEPIPLPPSPDIQSHSVDGTRPPLGLDRETIVSWSAIIREWAQRKTIPMQGIQPAAWALLVAHRMRAEASNLANLHNLEVASPWRPGGVVRLEVLDEPEDDVPY